MFHGAQNKNAETPHSGAVAAFRLFCAVAGGLLIMAAIGYDFVTGSSATCSTAQASGPVAVSKR
jgi:hypothetical protein